MHAVCARVPVEDVSHTHAMQVCEIYEVSSTINLSKAIF